MSCDSCPSLRCCFYQKTYVCTASAVIQGLCTRDQLGRFIFDLPEGKSINDTSFWSARLRLPASNDSLSANGPWNNTAGNPAPQRRRRIDTPSTILSLILRQSNDSSPSELYRYTAPVQYPVRKTGYYCVGEWSVFRE